MSIARSEEPMAYGTKTVPVPTLEDAEDAVIAQALSILSRRTKSGALLASPSDVKDYLRLKIGALEHEVFVVAFLDNSHGLISLDEMFRGTLTQAAVYPREIVKAAMRHNAAGVILAHNHPSGSCEPSRADETLTSNLKSALTLVDVRVLDHVIVSSSGCVSMAERGLL